MVRNVAFAAIAAAAGLAGGASGFLAPASSSSTRSVIKPVNMLGAAVRKDPFFNSSRSPFSSSSSCLHSSSVSETETDTASSVSEKTNGEDPSQLATDLQVVEAVREEENWEIESKFVELALLLLWMGGLSGFIFANNWIGPWPAAMTQVPERVFFTFHMLGGMLFGGGIIMTTALEWLVTKNKNAAVLQFYFDKVPLLDMALVLPGLTAAMISGTGLCITRYGSLGTAPTHIPAVFYCLTAFAAWWAATDLATQGKALRAIDEWVASATGDGDLADIPQIVEDRFISNIVSCGFVVALYAIMVLKPGTLPQYTPHLPNFFG